MLERTHLPYHITAGILNEWEQGLAEGQSQETWRRFTTVTTSGGSAETQTFTGDLSQFQEWNDELREEDLNEYHITFTNVKYGKVIWIDQDLIEDDRTDAIYAKVRALGNAVPRFMEYKAYSVLSANPTGYDSQALLSATHNESGTNQSNITTNAFSAANMKTGIQAMWAFTDDKGNYLRVNPDLVVTSRGNYFTAWAAVQSELSPDAVTTSASGHQTKNVLASLFQVANVFWSPHLNANAWLLIDTKQYPLPLIWQERLAPTMYGPEYDSNRDAWKIQIKLRGVFGAGRWQGIYGRVS